MKLQFNIFIGMISSEDCIENAKNYFTYGIFPQIIRKWYIRMPVADKDSTISIPATVDTSDSKIDDDNDDDIGRCWYYCDQPSFGDMIMCDNKKCTICWFHFDFSNSLLFGSGPNI